MRTTPGLIFLALSLPTAALAQNAGPDVPAPSPKARIEQRVGVTDFSVDYSSPGVKGRKIWGTLVPYDQLWRTGANAATKLTASRDFTFGGKNVPAGAYALYTIPGKTDWKVMLNSNANTGGTTGYDEKNNVATITVKPEAAPMRERLTILFSDTTDEGTKLDVEWEKLRVRIPLGVDTKAQVTASIDKTLADAWRPHFVAARYLLDSNGDLDKASEWIEASIAIKATWWNNWIKAQILAKKGKKKEAAAAAEAAQNLGKGDQTYEGFFKNDIAKSIADWKSKG